MENAKNTRTGRKTELKLLNHTTTIRKGGKERNDKQRKAEKS